MFRFLQRRKDEALLKAIAASDVNGVSRSLKAKADSNCADKNGWPCIAKAASIGNIDIATALLDEGAQVNRKFPAVLDERQKDVYEELYRRGLRASMPEESWSALLEAVSQGHLSMVRLLLKRGADPNSKHPAKLEPDIYVHHSVHQSMGSQIGLDPHRKDGWTALMQAAEMGHAEIVEALLTEKAEFRATSEDGTTALMRAAMGGHVSCVRALLAKGSSVDQTNSDGWTALFCACARGHLSVIHLLLTNKADVNLKNRSNATPLMWAVRAGPEAVKILLAAGVRVNEVSDKGGSALMAAVMGGQPEVVRLLLSAGADATVRDKQGTPLVELARSTFHREIIDMISTAVS
jgi:uncharacterized protein